METIKLKVSSKGQITLPKLLRKKLAINEYVHLRLDGDKAILEPVRFEDELEDLIVREVQVQGYVGKEAEQKVREKKLELLNALKGELEERKQDETVSYQEALKELDLE